MDKASINIKDIAKLSGVSVTTVSRIINNTGGGKGIHLSKGNGSYQRV